jgi:tyrosyl-tRNA synthetase
MTASLYDILTERGFVAQSTTEDMRERLQTPQTAYIGFDPTADSLHVGSLVPIMGLAWLQRTGHRPLALVGGATALIGDPSGKSSARKMLTRDDVNANAAVIGQQIGRLVRFGDGPHDAQLLNNADWLADISWIDILREAGPHFSVNRMLTMDSVKGRIESGGISFLEFNYMVMQAYDFMHLHRHQQCTLQMGGQDQWGNIVMGIELARRVDSAALAGLTFPLVTKSDGGKFGKSEQGNIWLSADRTPVFEFFQFWRNVADADVASFLARFTFLPMEDIRRLTSVDGAALNEAKEVLAIEVTKLIHGEAAAAEAQAAAKKAFGGSGAIDGDSVPHADLPADELENGIGLLALVVRAGLAKSNGEARRHVQGGAIKLFDARQDDPTLTVTTAVVQDGMVVVRMGKKKVFRFDVV